MSRMSSIPTDANAEAMKLERLRQSVDPLSLIVFWYRRQMQRQALRCIGTELLTDIGLSEAEAEREYSKPFWR